MAVLADLLLVSTYTPVVIVMMVKTNHIRAMEVSSRGRLPTRLGRNAKANEQAKLNIWDVAVIRVVSIVLVIPALLSIDPR